MKNFKLTKIIASLLVAVSVLALNPIGSSAEWKQDSTGWWYAQGDSYAKGEKLINGHYYYFDNNGYMNTGWRKDNGNWFYYDNYGYTKEGWIQDGGQWYYLDPIGGRMLTNTSVEGWYLNDDGVGTKCVNIKGFQIDKATGTIVSYTGNDTSLVIPSEIDGIQIKSIMPMAFDNSRNLTSITIPYSVTFIDPTTFTHCYNLSNIIVDDLNINYSSVDGVLFNKYKSKIIYYPIGKETKSYMIPDSVTELEDYAFQNCSNLTSISIPNSDLDIGRFAFENCTIVIFYVKSEKLKQSLIKCGVDTSKIVLNLDQKTITK